jgi:hypothetical protein
MKAQSLIPRICYRVYCTVIIIRILWKINWSWINFGWLVASKGRNWSNNFKMALIILVSKIPWLRWMFIDWRFSGYVNLHTGTFWFFLNECTDPLLLERIGFWLKRDRVTQFIRNIILRTISMIVLAWFSNKMLMRRLLVGSECCWRSIKILLIINFVLRGLHPNLIFINSLFNYKFYIYKIVWLE